MRWPWPFRCLLAALALAFISTGPANAACTGLGCACSIDAQPMSFGNYNPLSGSNVDAAGDVSVTCGALVAGVSISYVITLSPGTSGNQLARTMSSGGNTLSYNLYTNNTRTTVWGDGSGGTGTRSNSYLLTLILPRTDHFAVYGRIPGGQNAHIGSYSDTIVATVIF